MFLNTGCVTGRCLICKSGLSDFLFAPGLNKPVEQRLELAKRFAAQLSAENFFHLPLGIIGIVGGS